MTTNEMEKIFAAITSASTVNDLKAVVQGDLERAILLKDKKYPGLNLIFDLNIEQLKNHFDFDNGVFKTPDPSPMEKIIYAVSWKQGDAKKIKYVFEGLISNADEAPEKGMTFWYFGRHLKDPVNNPIIDRNVILAYAILKKHPQKDKIAMIATLSIKEKDLIEDFIQWYRTEINITIKSDKEVRKLLDDILFCIGQLYRRGIDLKRFTQ